MPPASLSHPTPPAHADIRSLAGLRGLAACWVMLGHYGIGEFTDAPAFAAGVAQSYLAVDLFMLLSGFVLAMSYGAVGAPGGYRRFLRARLARLYPLYALTSLVCLAQGWAGLAVWGDPDRGPLAVAANLAMVQSWGWPDNSLNSPGWSISTEWAANMLFGVLVVLLLRAPARFTAAVMVTALGALAGFALLLGPTPVEEMMRGQIGWYTFPYALLRCVTEFMLGMVAWRLRTDAPWTRVLGRTAVLLGLLVGLVISALVPGLDLVFLLCTGALVIGVSREMSIVARGLGSALPHWLGDISFSIYLWQIPLLALRPTLLRAMEFWGMPWPNALASGLCMLVLLAGASASFRWFETPARRWLRGR